jgi:hypothetical protein
MNQRYLSCVFALFASSFASAAPFTTSNLVVTQVGSNTRAVALNGSATEVLLKEFTPGGTLVQTIPLPSSGSGTKLTLAGNVTYEGQLSFYNNFFSMMGYDATAGASNVALGTATTFPRVVMILDKNGNIDLTTRMTDTFPNNDAGEAGPRSAVTNGTRIWMAGKASPNNVAFGAGHRTTTNGSTTSNIIWTGIGKSINVYNDRLFFHGTTGILTPEVALPATASVSNAFILDFSLSISDFCFTDPDTLYIADDSGTKGVTKYVWSGSAWNPVETITAGLSTGVRSIAGYKNAQGEDQVYVVTSTTSGPNSVFKLVPGEFGSQFSLVVTSGTHNRFKSVEVYVPSNTVSGTLQLQSYDGPVAPGNFRFDFYQGGVLKESKLSNVAINGTYSLNTTLPAGSYDVLVRGTTWLTKKVSGVTLAPSTTVNAVMVNGNANDDDSVDLLDYFVLSDTYNLGLGDAGYNDSADFNGDNSVDLLDYFILSDSYNKESDLP